MHIRKTSSIVSCMHFSVLLPTGYLCDSNKTRKKKHYIFINIKYDWFHGNCPLLLKMPYKHHFDQHMSQQIVYSRLLWFSPSQRWSISQQNKNILEFLSSILKCCIANVFGFFVDVCVCVYGQKALSKYVSTTWNWKNKTHSDIGRTGKEIAMQRQDRERWKKKRTIDTAAI